MYKALIFYLSQYIHNIMESPIDCIVIFIIIASWWTIFTIKIYCYHSSPRKKLISKVFARLHPPGNLEFVAKRRLKKEKTGATCTVSTLYFLIWKSWRGGGARGYNRQYLNILVKECLVREDIKMNGGGPTSIHH